MKDVVFLSVKEGTPATGYWDHQLLTDIFYDAGCNVHYDTSGLEEALVIIPGAYQGDLATKINQKLALLKRVVVVITSDEERKFPVDQLSHPNMVVHVQYGREGESLLPLGYTPHTHNSKLALEKDIDVLFAGQLNSQERLAMIQNVSSIDVPRAEFFTSDGFAKGLDPAVYMDMTARSKVVLCPKGNVSYDTFRLYEALESGAVPIAENPEYWDRLFPKGYPFPVVSKPEQWRGYAEDAVYQYPKLNNRCAAWWMGEKLRIRERLLGPSTEAITVVVPVSPIPSHPDTTILEETIDSIRFHLKRAEIVLTFDGVREENEGMRKPYEEHIRRVLQLAKRWGPVRPLIFEYHNHQARMMAAAVQIIKTPLVLYVEQDTPIVTDEPIDWLEIVKFVLEGESNLVRFYHETAIHPDHKHLMMEKTGNFTETMQWSQRPHVAATSFYQSLLTAYFRDNSRCFIEDRLHGPAGEMVKRYGRSGWNQWRLHLYTPDTPNIKRSYHLDGRAGAEKYEDKQVW